MKLRVIIFWAIGSLVFLGSCNESADNEQSFIFGGFAGECVGDCVTIFKLTDEGVWEDKNDIYPGSIFSGDQFDFEELPSSKFELVDGFIIQFPLELLDEEEDRLGCPDCYDQGGIYLEWNTGDVQRSWTIDVRKEEVPDYLHDFMDQLSENIKLLNQ